MDRNTALRLIHMGKRQLGLDDTTYRLMLNTVTGKDSAKDLTAEQRDKVIAHMVGKGATLMTHSPQSDTADWRTPRIKKIRRLWTEMVKVGVVNANGLAPWFKRQYQIDRLEWASAEQLNNIIFALQQWAEREGVESVIEYERKQVEDEKTC